MKAEKEKREELNRAYCAAQEQAGITSWTEFANFLNIPVPTIYRMIKENGKISENMLRRVYTELAMKGISVQGSPVSFVSQDVKNASAPVTQTASDPRWFELVAEKDKQIDRLLGIIENMNK